VLLVVGSHQREGDGEIAQGVGGQEQGPMTKMDFVQVERAREILQGPLTVGRHVDLADLPVEAVVQKALGEIEVKIALQRLAKAFHAHSVVEQTVDDRVANSVGVLGARIDPLDLGPEGLATRTAGAVFSDGQFDEENLAVSDIADRAGMRLFELSTPAAVRTGKRCRSTMTFDHANAWLDGFHACVPPGLSS
jgi:hypothetical protein